MPVPASGAASRWAAYLKLGRISNLPTVWTNCLAGIFLAGATPSPGTVLWLLVALSCFYTGGMFLNDAFDAKFDRQLRPERPIPRGEVNAREVYGVGFALLAIGEALIAVAGRLGTGAAPVQGLIGGAVLCALIVYYDFHHKNNILSPLVMALCRAMVYVTVALTAATPGAWAAATPLWWGVGALVCYLVGLTYAAKQENLREIRNLWPLLFLAVPFAYRAVAWTEGPAAALVYAVFLGWVLYGLSFIVVYGRRNIPRAVALLIAGISLLDALLMTGVNPGVEWIGAAAVCAVLTLALQRFVSGT